MQGLKIKVSARLFLCAAALLLLLFACKATGTDTDPTGDTGDTSGTGGTKQWTVTVEPNGGTGVELSYTVNDGATLDLPIPKKDGNDFAGWTDSSTGTIANFISANTVVSNNIKIYALWNVQHYTVTLDPNGGTVQKTSYTDVAYNSTMNITETPTAAETYQTSVKEYRDQDGNIFVPNSTQVKKPLTLKTIWNVNLITIRDILTGGSSTGKVWTWDASNVRKQVFTFTSSDQSSLEIKSDHSYSANTDYLMSQINSSAYPQKATITASTNAACIVEFSPPFEITSTVSCLEALSGTQAGGTIKATFPDANQHKVYTRQ